MILTLKVDDHSKIGIMRLAMKVPSHSHKGGQARAQRNTLTLSEELSSFKELLSVRLLQNMSFTHDHRSLGHLRLLATRLEAHGEGLRPASWITGRPALLSARRALLGQ